MEEKIIISIEDADIMIQDSGHGPAVMFVHGWPESSHCWEPVLKFFPGKYRLIRPDLRGLGQSSRTENVRAYTKDKLARDLIAVLDKLEIEKVGLVGHDWGGAVAQEMAYLYPDRISALVIMNIMLILDLESAARGKRKAVEAGGGIFSIDWYQSFMQTELPEVLVPGNELAWISHFVRSPRGVAKVPESHIKEYARLYSIPGTPGAAANYYRTMFRDMRRWQSYKRENDTTQNAFPMPVLLIWGTKDPVITTDYAADYKKVFPDARYVEIEAGHFLQEECPQEVAAEIVTFLGENKNFC